MQRLLVSSCCTWGVRVLYIVPYRIDAVFSQGAATLECALLPARFYR